MLTQFADSSSLTTPPARRPWRLRFGIAEVAQTALVAALSGVRARVRKQPRDFEPDPYVTDPPFLSDRWPRQ